jgi:prepilin-type N-terminal cleavage/methylation domain-containing protein
MRACCKSRFHYRELEGESPRAPSRKKWTCSPIRSQRCRFGFTLIEQLIVVAVLAILASLLLPVLSRAKAAAKQVHCISNAISAPSSDS